MELYRDSNGVTWVLSYVRPQASQVQKVVAWIDPNTGVKYEPLPTDIGPLMTASEVKDSIEKYAAGHKRDVVLVVRESASSDGGWLVLAAIVIALALADE